MSFGQRKFRYAHSESAAHEAQAADPERAGEIIKALIGSVLVKQPVLFPSQGAIDSERAISVWTWLVRDVEPALFHEAKTALSPDGTQQLRTTLCAKISSLIAEKIAQAKENPDFDRRLTIQLGGQEIRARLSQIKNAFKYHQLLPKAVAFGRAINGVRDEHSLKLALKSFPVNDPGVFALMMQAAIGQITNPNRLLCVILSLSGGETQAAVTEAGFAPVIEAMIAHAQNQLWVFNSSFGTFADIDLVCQALERYHRLIRAISTITDGDKSSQWAEKVSGLTRHMSELIEPKLTNVDALIRQSLRKPRIGPDQVDNDLLLEALNGLYLLAAAREARDSLALNSLVNNAWNETGKALEVLVSRNLEAFRHSPQSNIVAQRLNAGIKMAEVRFNPEYADILKRARDGASRL
ncbi:hypothetical protein MNBD_ALPHA12-414 [hydrothermal vent metagenome]|uniref:Uncharacterized protein n=1 Tax=hydrothermal vent metagenome TaxID=652676 RepID=A0A3B0U521_9ZZZZ